MSPGLDFVEGTGYQTSEAGKTEVTMYSQSSTPYDGGRWWVDRVTKMYEGW